MLYFQPTKLIALVLLTIVGCTSAAAEGCWIDESNWKNDGRRVKGEMVYDKHGKNGICVRNDTKPSRPYVKDCSPECDEKLVALPGGQCATGYFLNKSTGKCIPRKLKILKPAAAKCRANQVLAPSGECVAAGQCRSGHVLSSSTGRCIPNVCRPGNRLSSATGRCVPDR